MPMTTPASARSIPWKTTISENVAGFRAESHADADLLAALLHGVSHQAVDAQGSQEQRRGAEDGHQKHIETLPRRGSGNDFVHGADVGDGEAARLAQLLLDCGAQR